MALPSKVVKTTYKLSRALDRDSFSLPGNGGWTRRLGTAVQLRGRSKRSRDVSRSYDLRRFVFSLDHS